MNSAAKSSGFAKKHLGLPSMVGKLKYKTFKGLKENVGNRCIAGQTAYNEILIKFVIQSILTYTMSVFKLPKKLCEEITRIIAKF